MIYTIDRVQYVKEYKAYIFYEFMEVNNIHALMTKEGNLSSESLQDFLSILFTTVNNIEKDKVLFLLEYIEDAKVFIFYQKHIDNYMRVMITHHNEVKSKILTFKELQNWFQKLNNLDNKNNQSNSKGLGVVRKNNLDDYVNNILQNVYKVKHYNDDNGLRLTKNLLGNQTTKGFDFDLFQYIPATNQYIIYEFLKRENEYINNIQAHPMRYCWTGKYNDNKQKFISLWNAKRHLNGKLILVSYSDDPTEEISLIDILNIDDQVGITSENKYSMTQDDFLNLLLRLERLKESEKEYFYGFKSVHYNEKFFRSFHYNKSKYGVEFLKK